MKLLLYCTKTKPYLHKTQCIFDNSPIEWQLLDYDHYKKDPYVAVFGTLVCDIDRVNGKIVAECDFEVEEITTFEDYTGCEIYYETNRVDYERLLQKSCLDNQQLDDYLYGDKGYAIHIKNLHIFDEPKELSDYYTFNGIVNNVNNWKPIDKAPQNMMYAYDLISELGFSGTYNMHLKRKILISIKPQWMCKILNGEKTIEVRKKVLKEMLSNE